MCEEYRYKTLAVWLPTPISTLPTKPVEPTLYGGAQQELGIDNEQDGSANVGGSQGYGARHYLKLIDLPISQRILGSPTASSARLGGISMVKNESSGNGLGMKTMVSRLSVTMFFMLIM